MSLVFNNYEMPTALVENLRAQNPWWEGAPQPLVPLVRRWPFQKILSRLRETQPMAPIVALRGPRQVGKSSLQAQLIEKLLEDGVAPNRILRVQFDDLASLDQIPSSDDPILRVTDWYQRVVLEQHFNTAARAGSPAFLFFDEIQNLKGWDAQLKSLVDHASARVMITGSSSLQIKRGSDSLAGRIQTMEMGPLRLWEIAEIRGWGNLPPFQVDNGLDDWVSPEFWRELVKHAKAHAEELDQVFKAFSDRGAYPMPHVRPETSWEDLASFLNETVVYRVIQHDLHPLSSNPEIDSILMGEVFRMTCRDVGKSPSPAKLSIEASTQLSSISSNVSTNLISKCLDALDQSLLIRTINPLEARQKRRGKAHKKLVLCDHTLRAAWLHERIPLTDSELSVAEQSIQTLAGFLADSTVGYYLASLTDKSVGHIPGSKDTPEIDYVVTIGDRRIPIEVKYRTSGIEGAAANLIPFLNKQSYNASTALVVTRNFETAFHDARIICVPLKALLLLR